MPMMMLISAPSLRSIVLSLSEFIQMLYVMILSSVPVATIVTPINHVAPPLESLVIGGAS
jgi:hypothetical protein